MQSNTPEIKIIEGRRVGNTTRLIDVEIQELFQEGSTLVWDHAERIDGKNMAHEDHYRRLLRRLKDEHGLSLKDKLDYDKRTKILKLKKANG